MRKDLEEVTTHLARSAILALNGQTRKRGDGLWQNHTLYLLCLFHVEFHQPLPQHRHQKPPQQQPGDHESQQQIGEVPECDLHAKGIPGQIDMQKIKVIPKLRNSP